MIEVLITLLVIVLLSGVIKVLVWDPMWEYPQHNKVVMDAFIDFRSDHDHIWVSENFMVQIGDTHYVLPKGAVINFASIPWFVRWLISPIDMVLFTASCLHDWQVDEFGQNPRPLKWDKAAANMRNLMRHASPNASWRTRLKRNAVYWAVRSYGVIR